MFSYSGRAYILMCGSDLSEGSDSFAIFRLETWNATRYVDIFGVTMKFSRMKPSRMFLEEMQLESFPVCSCKPTYSVDAIGMLDSEVVLSVGRIMLILKVAFLPGLSKPGKARRASIGENCVLTNQSSVFVFSLKNDPR